MDLQRISALPGHRTSLSVASVMLVLTALTGGCSAAVDRLAIADAQTAVQVRTALVNDPDLGERQIDVRVAGGVVQLSGSVETQAEADRAAALARSVAGVRDVQLAFQIGGSPQSLNVLPAIGPAFQDEFEEDQGDPRLLALGASLGWTGPKVGSLDSRISVGPLLRLGSGRGFGPALALNWFQTDLQPDPTQPDIVSRIHVRPLMVGVAYTMASERVSVSPSIVGGYAFNSLSAPESGIADRVAVEVDNSFVWRPGVSVWLDVSQRFAINLSAGYVMTRLRVTFLQDGRFEKRGVQGDTTIVHAGLAYKLF